MLNQYGGYLKENQPVVIVGRFSVREDKDPQIIVNRARPISDYAHGDAEQVPAPQQPARNGTLYLRLQTQDSPLFGKIRAITNMFPGDSSIVVYFADTKQRMGARGSLDERMLAELRNLLGEENVVVK